MSFEFENHLYWLLTYKVTKAQNQLLPMNYLDHMPYVSDIAHHRASNQTLDIFVYQPGDSNKNVDIKFSARDVFLE